MSENSGQDAYLARSARQYPLPLSISPTARPAIVNILDQILPEAGAFVVPPRQTIIFNSFQAALWHKYGIRFKPMCAKSGLCDTV
jgi:hypothetical protein